VEAERTDIFKEELSGALSGELGGMAAEVGLTAERLFDEGMAAEAQIAASANASWAKVEAAERERAELAGAAARRRYELRFLRTLMDRRTYFRLGGAVAVLFLLLVLTDLVATPVPGVPVLVVALGLGLLATGLTAAVGLVVVDVSLKVLLSLPDPSHGKERHRAALTNYRRELRQAGIESWIRERINRVRGLSYETTLSYRDASGLAEIDDPSHEIPTEARNRLTRMIDGMPGGAIGLAGPRGAGKSTLMRSVCGGGADGEGDEALSVIVDAPVQYDSREFILHLFARLCSEVLGPTEVRAAARLGLSVRRAALALRVLACCSTSKGGGIRRRGPGHRHPAAAPDLVPAELLLRLVGVAQAPGWASGRCDRRH